MARQRNPARDEAYRLWVESGGALTSGELAELTGVENTLIRKWKTRDKWSVSIVTPCVTPCVTPSVTPKTVTPPAVTAERKRGAPPGNKNARTHGLRERVYWDTLDDDEVDMIRDMEMIDEEAELVNQLRLLDVRERRIMREIATLRKQGPLVVKGANTRKSASKVVASDTPYTTMDTTTNTIATRDEILEQERELTKVQRQKTRCIELLSKIRFDKIKLEMESHGNEVADDWIAALNEDTKDE